MFLKTLTARGFKSFADRTVLEFSPGVSVIVGPNGSGKSNIADAIAWVLGEQGARSLRGSQMADVIFAGSPGRPALGMAEVTLVIDNSAGLIRIGASEIEVSRTLYRNGESEYRLGGRPVRLLDIQEMLSDAGLGRALHAVVGQGQLDEVLQARPEDRRQLIEEAAGIAKHRRRRERAERKLQGLEGDLHRLQDLAGELRRQLRPLEKQAELAARHERLRAEASELAVSIAAARLHALRDDRERRRSTWEAAERAEADAKAALEALDARIAGLEQARAEAESEELLAGEAHAAAVREKSALEADLRAALRWESAARERLQAATGAAGRLFALEEELGRTRAAEAEVAASFRSRELDLTRAEEDFRARDHARRELEEQHRRAGADAATLHAETEALRASLAHQEAEQERLARSLGDIGGRLARAETRRLDLSAQVERFDAETTPLAGELAAVEAERSELGMAMAGLEAEERGLQARLEAANERLSELSESPGAAFARRRGERPLGVLMDLLQVPRNLEPAVRGALGPFADAVVYATTDEMLAEVTAADGGPGLVLATATGAPPRFSLPGERCVLDLVRADPRVAGLAGSLLADCYLVSNLAEASAKHRRYPHAHFVTEAGIVVGPTFVRTPSRTAVGTESVRREIGAIEREMASVRRGLREGRQRLAELEERGSALRARLEELDARITEAADAMSAVQADVASLKAEQDVTGERLRAVLGTATATRARLAASPQGSGAAALPELPPRPEPPVSLRVEVESLRRERGRLAGAVQRMERELEELRAEDPESLGQALRAAEGERAALEERLREAEAGLTGLVDEYRAVTERARRARDDHAQANRAWREHAVEVERLRTEHETEHRARGELEGRIADAERVLRQGHAVDPDAAVATLSAEDSVEELQRRSDLVAKRLALMGKVNLLAVGELDSLRDRHDFLVRELEDVRAARRDLQDVILDIDRKMAELFEQAFRDVAAAFSELFGLLFPGGEGKLLLTDPSAPLASGIEVEARPGRKRVKRLSLLSGGERSLAALAFLMAIFRARPSPFYLLDEVEAALDDINLHRFLDVLADLASRSQVLVVTHQKRTMETADVLYGVSMSQDGTSKIIAQRLAVGRGDDRIDVLEAGEGDRVRTGL